MPSSSALPPPRDWGAILLGLEKFYAKGVWRVPVLRERGADPYGVLVSTIISHRTRDLVTERATRRLMGTYPDIRTLAKARLVDIRIAISDAGLSNSKAHALRETARAIVRQHRGRVPANLHDLMSLPGVGRKTASAVLVFGFRRRAIPADVHIQRVANRLGVIRTMTRESTSIALAKVVPSKYWGRLNPVLVQHGQNLCTARSPRCSKCPIRRHCERVGVVDSR